MNDEETAVFETLIAERDLLRSELHASIEVIEIMRTLLSNISGALEKDEPDEAVSN